MARSERHVLSTDSCAILTRYFISVEERILLFFLIDFTPSKSIYEDNKEYILIIIIASFRLYILENQQIRFNFLFPKIVVIYVKKRKSNQREIDPNSNFPLNLRFPYLLPRFAARESPLCKGRRIVRCFPLQITQLGVHLSSVNR